MLNYSNNLKSKKPHFNVVIATPGNQMCAEYVKCLAKTIRILEQNNISWIYQSEYTSIITNAREATITGSKNLEVFNTSPGKDQYTYDKIFCIDSDIVWSEEQFIKLYTSDKSIISAVYYDANGTNAMVHHKKNDFKFMNRKDIEKIKEIFPVYGVGLGFVCIKFGVFESLKRPWFTLGKMVNEIDGIEYEIPQGEDLHFCERVSEKGHQVFVDPTIVVGHMKSNIIR